MKIEVELSDEAALVLKVLANTWKEYRADVAARLLDKILKVNARHIVESAGAEPKDFIRALHSERFGLSVTAENFAEWYNDES